MASSSRQRLGAPEWTSGPVSAPPDQRYLRGPFDQPEDERYEQQHFSNLMRTSSMRTPMSNDIASPMIPADTLRGHDISNLRGDSATVNLHSAAKRALPLFGELTESSHDHPKISLDINALSTGGSHIIDEYSGYDFLGEDLSALLGSVKSTAQPSPQTFEENAEVLWQAFHGKSDALFTS